MNFYIKDFNLWEIAFGVNIIVISPFIGFRLCNVLNLTSFALSNVNSLYPSCCVIQVYNWQVLYRVFLKYMYFH